VGLAGFSQTRRLIKYVVWVSDRFKREAVAGQEVQRLGTETLSVNNVAGAVKSGARDPLELGLLA